MTSGCTDTTRSGRVTSSRALIFARDRRRTIAADERAWGKLWHVPNAPATTQREIVQAFATAARTTAKVGAIPKVALSALGLFSPMMKGLQETWYQFAEPWVTDSTLTEQTFGLTATPLAEGAAATVAWWRAHSADQ